MKTQRAVTFLITALDPMGGAESQVVRIAKGLSDRGWKVTIVTLLSPGGWGPELAAAGIKVTSLSASGTRRWLIVPKLIWLLRRTRPQVLATFMFHSNVLGRLCGRLTGVPVVVSSIRNSDFGGPVRNWLEKRTMFLDTSTTTNSKEVARILSGRGIVAEDQVRVIPNGLTVGSFRVSDDVRQAVRSASGVGADTFVWLTIGHLYPQKDHGTLLGAFSVVVRQWSGVELWIAGEGPELERLNGLKRDLALGDRVRFLGRRSDIPKLLGAADAFVLSSAWEGSPNVLLEAFDAGRAIVATDVGGVREVVQHERTGFLVSPGDSAALAAAMVRLMSLSRDEREAMAMAGQERVRREFSLETTVDKWEQLFASETPTGAANKGGGSTSESRQDGKIE